MEKAPARFALIGAAGYIAPRHMKAIQEVGGELVAAVDPHDSVGILDHYFPDCEFFTSFERFERYLATKNNIDYVAICSPNYLHDNHIRTALYNGCNVICEKPVVINPQNIDSLKEVERKTGKKVNVVLQMRLHPQMQILKGELIVSDEPHFVEVDYLTPRGKWYDVSWKGNEQRSGGVLMNIGVHLFDALVWLFGDDEGFFHEIIGPRHIRGTLELERATVKYNLSIDGTERCRIFKVDGRDIDVTTGFEDLHTEVYRNVLSQRGYGLDEARKAIELVARIRQDQTRVDTRNS